jgi:hypothetical protein
MTRMDGLQRMLDFLDMLRDKGIHFWIEQQGPDGLMVTFTVVGARVEAVFTVDEMQYSIFTGNEDVEVDRVKLDAFIAERWNDDESVRG